MSTPSSVKEPPTLRAVAKPEKDRDHGTRKDTPVISLIFVHSELIFFKKNLWVVAELSC